MSMISKFNWSAINDEQFEELVYAIVESKKPISIKWRKGPGDKGRDIQATFMRQGALGETFEETYFIEAKHHSSGISPTKIAGALAWAQAERPSVLVLAVSSHITTPSRDHLSAWGRNNPTVRVLTWERKELENLILSSSQTRNFAVQINLLPADINELLPALPQEFRPFLSPDHIGFEMQYRYWITEEEIDNLDYVVDLLQRLKENLVKESDPHKYFEDVSLAVPNWSTFLSLFKAECRLQMAIRDYLFAQINNADMDELRTRAEKVKETVRLMEEIGGSSYHVD
jgi:Restriction endonuclease